MSQFAVLLLAAGQSSRFGDQEEKKPFAPLDGRAVWLHSAERFLNRADVCQTLLVISPDDRDEFQQKFGANLAFMDIDLCEGGAERSDSVRAGLASISSKATHVAVHDAARPCVSEEEIDRVFAAAVEHSAAILATPVADTLKRVSNNEASPTIEATISRESLWAAQTPQVFELSLLKKAHGQTLDQPVTDDAQLVEILGQPVAIVEGSPMNRKITTKQDLKLAELILSGRPKPAADKPKNLLEDDDFWE